tara:strand:- start:101 stop:286 length:186 start_codon:yes stop_codon:yes gene_type:complete
MGKCMADGVTVEMKRQAKDYGIQCRTLLLRIVALMIQNKISLKAENFFAKIKFESACKHAV